MSSDVISEEEEIDIKLLLQESFQSPNRTLQKGIRSLQGLSDEETQVQRHNCQKRNVKFLPHTLRTEQLTQNDSYNSINIAKRQSGAGVWCSAFRPNMVFISLPGDYQDRNNPRSV